MAHTQAGPDDDYINNLTSKVIKTCVNLEIVYNQSFTHDQTTGQHY